MRTLHLDPFEAGELGAEQYLGVITAARKEFKDLESFATGSGDSGANPFFEPIASPRRRTEILPSKLKKILDGYEAIFADLQIPAPVGIGYMYFDDWDHRDLVFESEAGYVRVAWETTA